MVGVVIERMLRRAPAKKKGIGANYFDANCGNVSNSIHGCRSIQ